MIDQNLPYRFLRGQPLNFLFSAKGPSLFSPHNETVIITNQQGLLKMATSQEMKKLSVLKRVLILQQEVNLKVAVSLFQVWKNIICFLLLMAPGMREGWVERSLLGH